MAVGIAIAAGAFTVIGAMTNSELPLPEGERVVSVVNWDASTSNRELRMLRDFTEWRGITSLEDLSITRTVQRNLIADGHQPETVTVAEISASAFRVARVAALRGRYLLPEDERPDAPDAILIGHDEWVRRFGADPEIVGRSVQLGSTTYAIVGVMPEGFAVSAEPQLLDSLAPRCRRVRAAHRAGREHLRTPRAGRDARERTGGAHRHRTARGRQRTGHARTPAPARGARTPMRSTTWTIPGTCSRSTRSNWRWCMLLAIICVNVAILVYARTATRQGEIAVRGALGASRRRIVAQLFVEALILAGIAAAWRHRPRVGGVATTPRLGAHHRRRAALLDDAASFDRRRAVCGHADAAGRGGHRRGPGAQGHRPQVQPRLQTLSAGSGSRMQMGRVWTMLIVAQVAFTVAVLPAAMFHAWTALRFRTGDAGFAASEFLTAQLVLDRTTFAPTDDGERAFTARFGVAHRELERRLENEAVISDVTFSMTDPGNELALVARDRRAGAAGGAGGLQHRRGHQARGSRALQPRRRRISSTRTTCRC